jgi:hypothetical protein
LKRYIIRTYSKLNNLNGGREMKKFIVVLIVFSFVFTLVACGKSIEDKLAEEIAEGIVSELGETNDISIDNNGEGKITINDGEGEMVIEGSESGMKWPSDKLPDSVPVLKGALVISIASTDGVVQISFEECNTNEANAYIEQIKNEDWNVLMESNETEGVMVSSQNDAGDTLIFVWDTEEQGGVITYSVAR